MKNWIKVIFALNNRLDALTYSIDREVEGMSALLTVPTMELFDSIIKLNDKKVRIINLRVLHDKMKETLSPREYYIIARSSHGASFSEIAEGLGLSKGHVYRLYQRTIQKLTRVLSSYGYTEGKFFDDYNDIVLIARMYKKLARTIEAA
ncbi:MAG: hypothetical protein J1F36_04840 [Clostridiales bacterium]|nr:hypothetical protein [Clostridiales bacterium]